MNPYTEKIIINSAAQALRHEERQTLVLDQMLDTLRDNTRVLTGVLSELKALNEELRALGDGSGGSGSPRAA